KAMPDAFLGSPISAARGASGLATSARVAPGAIRAATRELGAAGKSEAALRFTPPAGFKPRVDVADKFQLDRTDCGVVSFQYQPAENPALGGSVEDGVVQFSIRAEGDAQAFGSGSDMFHGMLQRLVEQERIPVKGIYGAWHDVGGASNTTTYWENRLANH